MNVRETTPPLPSTQPRRFHGSQTRGKKIRIFMYPIKQEACTDSSLFTLAVRGSVMCFSKSKSKSQSVLVSGAHLGPATNLSFSLKFSLDSCGFVIL
jgi:hypothetical protein